MQLLARLRPAAVQRPKRDFRHRMHAEANLGADFEMLLVHGDGSLARLLFERGAAAALLERLHPQGLGDMGDGFGEAVQRGGTGVQAGGER